MIKLDKELAYQTILFDSGGSHLPAIALLEEIIEHYQLELCFDSEDNGKRILHSSLIDGWKIDYAHFETKLRFARAKARAAFKALEKYQLAKRKHTIIPYIPKVQQGGSDFRVYLNLDNLEKMIKKG